MKTRSVVCCASALVTVFLLGACGSSDGDSQGAAGSSAGGASAAGANAAGAPAAGAPSSTAGGGSSAGGAFAGAGAPAAGAASGGASGAAAGTGGASAGSGGTVGNAGAGGGTSAIPKTKIVMYIPNWNGSFASWSTKLDWNRMTHLNLAFGVMKGASDWSLGASDSDVQAIAKAAHDHNVKILVSIGGESDDDGIVSAYGNAGNVDAMVTNLDAFIKRLNLDGVDIDLEQGSTLKTNTNFPKFIDKVNTTLKPEGKLVTAALAQYIMEDAGNDATINGWLTAYDFINVMIYDNNFKTYTDTINWWTSNRKVAKDKLVPGVTFDGGESAATVKQVAIMGKDYGGVMAWELSMKSAPTLYKVITDNL
jgi:chitinase